MKLTTKGRYAVSALLDLAEQGDNAIVSLADISERQKISVSYLEQLFSKLRKKGLVVSVRGATGGYQLALPIQAISVFDIINAVDESVNTTRCGNEANCNNGEQCATHELWSGLSAHIADYLSSITLAQLKHTNDKAFIHIKYV